MDNPESPLQQKTTEGGLYPMVQIGTNKVSQDDLNGMELNCDGFLPTARFTVLDTMNKLSAIDYPLDGDVVSLYLKPRPSEEYRPIRIDFDIASISSIPADIPEAPEPDAEDAGEEAEQEVPTPAIYTFNCVMKVPLIYADVVQGFASGNSFDHMMECAEGLGLGFASNEDATDDPMPRVIPNTSREEWIAETTRSAYRNDESFFTSYVDLHYYLSLVNVNKQFSEEDEMEQVSAVQQIDYTLQNNATDGEGEIPAGLRLSNSQDVKGTDMEITSHVLKNQSGNIWMQGGYARNLIYLNMNENNLADGATDPVEKGKEQFLITPLNTPGSDENRIPLRGRPDDDTWADNNKQKYLGKQPSEDFGNVHSNFMYAIGQNISNNDEIEKMYMEVDLATVNWSLYRYQRIPVIIYNTGEMNNKNLENRDRQLGEDTQPQNDESKGTDDQEVNYDDPSQMVKNEFLSGYYVISEITYKYDKGGPITQSLKLLRREWPIPARNKDN